MTLDATQLWAASHEELSEIADVLGLAAFDEANTMDTDELIDLLS